MVAAHMDEKGVLPHIDKTVSYVSATLVESPFIMLGQRVVANGAVGTIGMEKLMISKS